MCKGIMWRAVALVILVAGASAAARPAAAYNGTHLELVETIPDENSWGFSIGPGHLDKVLENGTEIHATWTELPQSFDATGFKITLTVSGQIPVTPEHDRDGLQFSGGISSYDTTVQRAKDPQFQVHEGESLSDSQEYAIAFDPQRYPPGTSVTIGVGVRGGIAYSGITYRYRVVDGGSAPANGAIVAELVDCPPAVTISELPSVFCHLKISGFRHNTADPVEVVLPSAIDMQGNHGNGLQLPQTAGALDVSRMDDPYMWGVTIFACPGQQGAAVSCNGTGAAPGPLSAPIVVRQQGAGETQVMLNITAVAGPNSVVGNGTGTAVTSTSVAAGPGQIGARIECPGTIFISALPSLNCHIVITGWLKDTKAPVRVSLPGSRDDFGNHSNGIQIIGQGEEDHFEWDNDTEHSWGIFVFACPGQSSAGVNCYDAATTPGVQALMILVEQDGLEPADLTFMIDAQPHP